jgi:hypothetical protein
LAALGAVVANVGENIEAVCALLRHGMVRHGTFLLDPENANPESSKPPFFSHILFAYRASRAKKAASGSSLLYPSIVQNL